jgi:hypothetical protein
METPEMQMFDKAIKLCQRITELETLLRRVDTECSDLFGKSKISVALHASIKEALAKNVSK